MEQLIIARHRLDKNMLELYTADSKGKPLLWAVVHEDFIPSRRILDRLSEEGAVKFYFRAEGE